jgi:hypothetical protein
MARPKLSSPNYSLIKRRGKYHVILVGRRAVAIRFDWAGR